MSIRLLLVLSAMTDPIWNWKHRDTFAREWRNGRGRRA